MITGKLRAWIEHCTKPGVLVAFIAVPEEDGAPLPRLPATRLCASLEEARRWVVAEAQMLGVPVEWMSGPCAPEAAD